MSYLFDTNIISELVSNKPNAKVIEWLEKISFDLVYLSVITLGEIRKGVEKIQDPKRKNKILIWLEHDLLQAFDMRILDITKEIADRWGRLQNQVKRTLPAIDSLIAATALHHDLILVTRNIQDFQDCPGLELLNPWKI